MILNLKLIENWLRCMLFILTRPWHAFRTRNVRMCLRPVLAWCPLTDTKTVSQCPSDGQKPDVASDVKCVWWRHHQTDVTIIKTRQSAMVKGNSMSQLVRTFDRGLNTQPGSQFVDLICFFTDLIPYPGRWWHWHTSALFQTWSPILEDNGTDTRQPCSSVLGGSDTDTRQPWSPDAGIVHSNFSSAKLSLVDFLCRYFHAEQASRLPIRVKTISL